MSNVSRRASVAASVTLLLAVTTLASMANSAAAAAKCHIVVKGAPWTIKTGAGDKSGSRYTIDADAGLCSAEKGQVVKFTHQTSHGLGEILKGPKGFICHSLSTAGSGDKLVYAGVCGHGTGYKPPGFGWAPLVKR